MVLGELTISGGQLQVEITNGVIVGVGDYIRVKNILNRTFPIVAIQQEKLRSQIIVNNVIVDSGQRFDSRLLSAA